MDPAYGARYRQLYRRHWWWRAREAVVIRELERLAPPGGWDRALDVGCGDGLLFPVLDRFADTVEGVEPDRGLVDEPDRGDGRIHLRPFDASFDPGYRYGLVLFLDVLEHMDDPEAAVAHAAGLLEPGGVALVTVPAWLHLWTTHDELNRHVTRYDAGRLRALLETELEVERVRYFFRWVHKAKLAQRAWEAVARPDPSPPSLPPAPVNATLYALSRVEEGLFGRISFPMGSSLLAVARKEDGTKA